LDGSEVGWRTTNVPSSAERTETLEIYWLSGHTFFPAPEGELPPLASVFEPGTETSHTLTAQVADDCGEFGGTGGGHVTIDSVSVDVIGIR